MVAPTEHSTCDVCKIVMLKTMACMWWRFARCGEEKPPRDVPPGHLAVVVGEASRRFIIRADYLNHPVFEGLLDQAYEEYGHGTSGPLAIPCDEFRFQEIIQSLGGGLNMTDSRSSGCGKANLGESTIALLQGLARRRTC